jgi:hypothetical protein
MIEATQRVFGDTAPIDHLDQLAAGAGFLRAQDGGGDGDLAEAVGELGGGPAGIV